jgi:glycosyltransferase involved in cell wall biosynthesis
MLHSLKAQTVPADEVVIVVSNVLTKANTSHAEASASDWCAVTQRNLVTWYNSSDSSKVKLMCVGERTTAGRARNLAARFASGDILSFIDADGQEVPIMNQIIQNKFEHCYPNR